jgi:hypothetical protein
MFSIQFFPAYKYLQNVEHHPRVRYGHAIIIFEVRIHGHESSNDTQNNHQENDDHYQQDDFFEHAQEQHPDEQ